MVIRKVLFFFLFFVIFFIFFLRNPYSHHPFIDAYVYTLFIMISLVANLAFWVKKVGKHKAKSRTRSFSLGMPEVELHEINSVYSVLGTPYFDSDSARAPYFSKK